MLKPNIDLMFKARNEESLKLLFTNAIKVCKVSNHCVLMLVIFVEKRNNWASYMIDQVQETFGLHGSSNSEYNHSSVKKFVTQNTEVIHETMQIINETIETVNDVKS